MTEKIIGLEV